MLRKRSNKKKEQKNFDRKMKYPDQADRKVFLVGNPNVGKSVIFNALTGSYVTVSNYPGTTVEVASGIVRLGSHHRFRIVDTPGIYSLNPLTAEESVTRNLIFEDRPDCIVHVVDAKNLDRMLPMTMQLIETGIPVILALNLYDEFKAKGMHLNIAHLEHDLGIPVVETVATSGLGIDNLYSRIIEVSEKRYNYGSALKKYSPDIEDKIRALVSMIKERYPVSERSLALLALQKDPYILEMIRKEKEYDSIRVFIDSNYDPELGYKLAIRLREAGSDITGAHLEISGTGLKGNWKEKLSRIMIHPVMGLPILGLVLWFGFYKFVGEFGAGTLVDFIEENIFQSVINPGASAFFERFLGGTVFFDLFAGEYGIVTLGLTYAFAIVMPIVATFFMTFSIIEDTGYLPRLAMLTDKLLKKIGLSGRAVIPLTLGFGCGTMATIVTRTLESKKERVIATFLLALAVPCSAQLGLLLGLMGARPVMLLIWGATVFSVFLLAGFLSKLLVKGEASVFFMELPPLRLPRIMNIFTKTYTRMVWYFKEIVPIFISASVLIWIGKLTGVFDFLTRAMSFPVKWAGMPEEVSPVLLYGFFRRDFGAAGLFDMARSGTIQGNGLLVAGVVLTLFVPCVAHFAVTWKERGKAIAIGMALFIFPFAFFVGFLLNAILRLFGLEL